MRKRRNREMERRGKEWDGRQERGRGHGVKERGEGFIVCGEKLPKNANFTVEFWELSHALPSPSICSSRIEELLLQMHAYQLFQIWH